MQATATGSRDVRTPASQCRLCHLRTPVGAPLCGGCAERLELELNLYPARACLTCGRHVELCALDPCGRQSDSDDPAQHPRVAWLPLKDIVPTPSAQNSRERYDRTALEQLTQSIRRHGILQPLCVRPFGDKYVLVFGLRRYRAATAAGLTEVPCVVLAADDSHALLLNLIENLQREQLRGSERLKAIERLAATGLGVRELSRRTGFAASTISRWLRIDRHPSLRAAVETGLVDVSRAMILVEVPEPDLPELLREAPRLSASELRDRVAVRRRRAVDPRADDDQASHVHAALCALERVTRHVSDAQLLDQLRSEVERVFSL